jgi:dCMP deaminase
MDSRIKTLEENPLGTRPNWDEYLMHIAIGIASRAACHYVRAGTIIVTPDHKIIGTGYNGAPSLIKKNCLETGCRKKNKGLDYHESLNSGACLNVHAEMNAAGHLTKIGNNSIEVYNTIFPCHTCAKNLLSYNPKRIIFKRAYSEKELPSTLDLFEEAGVEVYQLDLSPERDMDIRYNHPNVQFDVWSIEEKNRIKNFK